MFLLYVKFFQLNIKPPGPGGGAGVDRSEQIPDPHRSVIRGVGGGDFSAESRGERQELDLQSRAQTVADVWAGTARFAPKANHEGNRTLSFRKR